MKVCNQARLQQRARAPEYLRHRLHANATARRGWRKKRGWGNFDPELDRRRVRAACKDACNYFEQVYVSPRWTGACLLRWWGHLPARLTLNC